MGDIANHLLTLTLGPLLLAQGRRVRRVTPVLPEPPGERCGTRGAGRRGDGRPLGLLVVGDSAAAGVGAAHQDEALLGRLLEQFGRDHRVDWRLHAQTGATTESTLASLRAAEPANCDLVITSLGVNDVTSGVGRARWRGQQAALRDLLRDRFGARLIIASGLPPMHGFPALPQPLRWYLGRRATALDRALEHDVGDEPGAAFLSLRFSDEVSQMASDGFHPGPAIYAEWAARAADLARARLGLAA